ncbi:uncharacterized protein A4U43_C06F20130 [Asparagus officinalis]|uniref:Uncharacterized protein n=1 Tax=Asparagus officinalis TaxID=4686 RepID=A0A5P1ENB3_ASPOF|nr:uncharacterized protein A4U43_C06F20130 [Asparagus officinalis]
MGPRTHSHRVGPYSHTQPVGWPRKRVDRGPIQHRTSYLHPPKASIQGLPGSRSNPNPGVQRRSGGTPVPRFSTGSGCGGSGCNPLLGPRRLGGRGSGAGGRFGRWRFGWAVAVPGRRAAGVGLLLFGAVGARRGRGSTVWRLYWPQLDVLDDLAGFAAYLFDELPRIEGSGDGNAVVLLIVDHRSYPLPISIFINIY